MTHPYGFPPPTPWGPRHPRAGTSLALGLIAVVGALPLCGISLFVAPFAWAMGRRAVREIRASGGYLAGHGDAQAGMVLGIIGTALLVIYLLAIVLVVWFLGALVGGLEVHSPGGTPV